MDYICAQMIKNLRTQAVLAQSVHAAAHRSLEANLELLQGSMNAWTELLMKLTMIPYYYWERPEQPDARPSQEGIEESEFLRAASTVMRDHAEALRELSHNE